MLVGLAVGKRNSRPWIVSDELWLLIEPLLPEPAPKLVAGRPRVPDRQALRGILFVLHTGIQWEYLPQELDFGSGMTCWQRLAAWNEAGVWDRLHVVLLTRLRAAKQLDWSRAVIDSSHVRAARRGPKADPARSTGTSGQQAPRPRRRARHPPRGVADRRQPQRRHPADAPACQDPERSGPGRATATPARHLARRPWLRPRQVPPPRLGPGHQTGDRPTWRPTRIRTRRPPLGRRTHHRLAARLPTPTRPLGTAGRHPRSLPRPRHLPHHPSTRPTPLLGPLSRDGDFAPVPKGPCVGLHLVLRALLPLLGREG